MPKLVVPAVAFVATVALVVATRTPDAEQDHGGPAARPARRVIAVDGAEVVVDVASRVISSDGTITATISATAPTPRDIELDVRFAQTGQMQSRQMRHQSPTTTRETRSVTLAASPAGASTTIAFTARKPPRSVPGTYDLFELEVAPAVEAFQTTPSGAQNRVRIGIAGWTGSGIPVTVTSPKVTAEGPFEVDVNITNTLQTPIQLALDFGAPSWASGGRTVEYELDPDYRLEAFDKTCSDDDAPLPAGETRTCRYKLVPAHPGIPSFLVLANVRGIPPRADGQPIPRDQRARYLAITPGGVGSVDTTTFERPKH